MPPPQIENATATWEVGMCETCVRVPGYFFASLFCAPCCVCHQRYRILGGSEGLRQNYECCGGIFGCSCPESLKPCAPLWLCMEIVFCCWCALSGNRYLIQSRYFIMNTCIENTMIWLACIFSWIFLILSIFLPIPREAVWLCDCLYLCFSACLQSQQEAELDKQESAGAAVNTNQPKHQAYPIIP